ncbi:MAG: uroporphyrinogen-III C-methyltransferase [Chloroflexota bacterium]
MSQGKVYLVGAGPGDPGLITVRGMECLRQADVVVYDRLLDEGLLENAPPEAERIDVGKTAGEHPVPQHQINRLLVARAREGKTVVRLKGGDPFVLGRGGEEAAALADHGIPFQVVPGITSAVAVPAYAGIPVTHRGLASSFAVVTGHEDPTKDSSSINWGQLATGVDTIVFLMGMQQLPHIVSRLMENGRPPQTPVAVIKDGTRPGQQTVTGHLSDIVDRVQAHGLKPPAVIVVGDVVKLRESLRWYDNRPLSGKRVLVTRARHQASSLSRLLTERGALPVELPAIDIQPVTDNKELDGAIARLEQYAWVVFTSVNGVAAFFRRLNALKQDSRALRDAKIAAIGPATAAALEGQGIIPDYLPESYTGAGLLEGFRKRDIAGQHLLLPRADIADDELSAGLSRLGAVVDDIAVYRTVPATEATSRARQKLQAGEIDVITFTSSSTVSHLIAALAGEKPGLNGALVACIGPKTAQTATRAGLKVAILAEEPTIPGLVSALEEYFTKEK